jgi:hypothetical protein
LIQSWQGGAAAPPDDQQVVPAKFSKNNFYLESAIVRSRNFEI